MFSYYGAKGKIVDYYPPPKFDKIIEPFAGSARYSLKYWDRDILLVDKYQVIVNAWLYLIQASKSDILGLPKLKAGDNINNFDLSIGEKSLLSFLVNVCNTGRRSMTERSFGMYESQIKNIAFQIHKIKHWKIKLHDYKDLLNESATWFIDPPYMFGGDEYKESNKKIDFNELSNWCKSRIGHIIVCENTKADWMDFKPMVGMQGMVHKTTEAIWTNYPTSYNNNQLNIFK